MQLCVNTSTFGDPGDARFSVADKVRIAAETGFTHIEVWNSELTAWTNAGHTLAELRTIIADAGLAVPSVISLLGWMEGELPDEVKRRMEQAAELGAPKIVATPTIAREDEPYHFNLDLAASSYHALLDFGATLGIVPIMEFLGFVRSVHLLEQCEAIVELADHPDACLVLDPFHLWRGGSGFGRLGSLDAGRIGICHFNDAPADNPPRFEQGDADRVYPGDGCLPLPAMLATLDRIGYAGPLSLELFNRGYWALDPRENLRRGMESVQRSLAAAGLA